MKTLITAATPLEVKMIADEMRFLRNREQHLTSYELFGNEIDILITGIGTVFTTFSLTNTINRNSYSRIINIGIAGSINPELKIGEVVNVVTEEFADLGIENREQFLTLFESGFIDKDEFPFENGILRANGMKEPEDIRKVHGITSNRSHGSVRSISEIRQKYSADIETMEGAAIFYVCNISGIPCCQIRAVSNYVEPRDSDNWNIPLALENLKIKLLQFLDNNTLKKKL